MLQLSPEQTLQLANHHHRAGKFAEAQTLYDGLLKQFPKHVPTLGLAAMLAYDMNKCDDALALLERAIQLAPNHTQIHNQIALTCRRSGNRERAVQALTRAAELQPSDPVIHFNRAVILRELGDDVAAMASYKRSLEVAPTFYRSYENMGNIYKDHGDLENAMDCFKHAKEATPDDPLRTSSYLCTMLFCPGWDSASIRRENDEWDQRCCKPLRQNVPPHTNTRDPNKRLRLGFASPFFRDHVVGRNMIPLFRDLDRSQFEIVCYSDTEADDAITNSFRTCSLAWRNVTQATHEQIAQQVRSDGIDIFIDLTLHMHGNRLPAFARKPAPVQVTFAGYPASSGCGAIDYRLTDPFLDPEGENATDANYIEKSIRIPSFWCYDKQAMSLFLPPDLAAGPLPALANNHVTFGCLNNFCKTNPVTLKLWARVLRQLPTSRLILLAHEGEGRNRFASVLTAESIDPARVEFVKPSQRPDYMKHYQRIDIGLDTLPYNGHTTSLDSLWMGVPVVTLVGQTVVGRAGLSQLSNLNLPELITWTEDDFVSRTLALAQDLPRLETLRNTLRQRMEQSPLCDAKLFTRSIESALRTMWQTWCTTPTSS